MIQNDPIVLASVHGVECANILNGHLKVQFPKLPPQGGGIYEAGIRF